MKEKSIPFSTRMEPRLKEVLVDYCMKEGLNIQKFIHDAVIRELAHRRKGGK